MAVPQFSNKHLAINKANARMVATVGVAAFVTVFCLVAAHSVWGQTRYQARVITAKNKANQQLKKNITAFSTLQSAYNGFDAAPTNIIGGNAQGSGDNDGSNSKIILDALPDSYNFPALTSSLQKILADRGFHVTNISGTDDQLNQQNNQASPTPQAVNMPFSFTVNNADYSSLGKLIEALQNSIRPIQIDSLTLNGASDNMTMTVNAHTFYQPSKNVSITKKVIK